MPAPTTPPSLTPPHARRSTTTGPILRPGRCICHLARDVVTQIADLATNACNNAVARSIRQLPRWHIKTRPQHAGVASPSGSIASATTAVRPRHISDKCDIIRAEHWAQDADNTDRKAAEYRHAGNISYTTTPQSTCTDWSAYNSGTGAGHLQSGCYGNLCKLDNQPGRQCRD